MFHDVTSRALVAALDIRSARHGRLAHNVANADTPGYRPVDVDFDASLQAHLQVEPGELVNKDELLVERPGHESAPDADGNTVDLDKTLAELSANGLEFSGAIRFTSKRLAMLRYVVNDGLG